MKSTFVCLHCGRTCKCNPCVKNQKYCSRKECQQARRSARKKERYKNDPAYRKKQLESQKAWRKRRPSHEYQRDYRESRPEYVKRNREQQKERNKKRQKRTESMIVNGTSLSLQPSNDESYAIFKVKNEKIVNGTSFMAQMQILSREEAILLQNSV